MDAWQELMDSLEFSQDIDDIDDTDGSDFGSVFAHETNRPGMYAQETNQPGMTRTRSSTLKAAQSAVDVAQPPVKKRRTSKWDVPSPAMSQTAVNEFFGRRGASPMGSIQETVTDSQ